eukprot:2309807-Rhodomonas_salina.1
MRAMHQLLAVFCLAQLSIGYSFIPALSSIPGQKISEATQFRGLLRLFSSIRVVVLRDLVSSVPASNADCTLSGTVVAFGKNQCWRQSAGIRNAAGAHDLSRSVACHG